MKIKTPKLRLSTPLCIKRPLPVQQAELDILRPRPRLSVDQWALQRRILSKKTSKIAGPWSHEYVPFAVEIMQALSDNTVREVWLKKNVQGAGTSIGENFIGQTVDEDPCPMGVVFPTESSLKKFVRTRLKQLFSSTPSLIRHLPAGDIEKFRTGQETELDNMFLFLMWAGSAAEMASVSLCRIILDEVAKYKGEVGGEAGAIESARDRVTTFPDRSKIFALSTPILAGDIFDIEYSDTDQREYWVRCPLCGQRHVPAWEYVRLDKDSAGGLLRPRDYLQGDCAHYVCPVCEKKWTEMQRWQASQAGVWAPQDCRVDGAGKITGKIFSNPKRGYHASAFMVYPGFMTMARLAYEWARADIAWKAGYRQPKQSFYNKRCGLEWQEKEAVTEESVITAHIGEYLQEIVPAGVQMLTAGVDVHDDHFWLLVVGWGWLSECWSIYEARIESGDTRELNNYDCLRQQLAVYWPLKDNPDEMMGLARIAIDCNYRKEVVLDFCRQCTELPIVPVRGDDSVKGSHRAGDEGGLKRFDLNVNRLKDKLYRLFYESKTPGAGFFHLHKDTSAEVIRHLTSEEKKTVYKKGKRPRKGWMPKAEGAPNHLWDCAVYATFAAELAGATMLRDPVKAAAAAAAAKKMVTERMGARKIRTKY